MNCQRKGTNLKIDIRLALSSLGRDPYIKLDRLRIAQLEDMLTGLRLEQKARGGILKETYTAFNSRGQQVAVTIPTE